MKKVFLLLFVAAAFASCGGSDSDAEGGDSSETKKDQSEITVTSSVEGLKDFKMVSSVAYLSGWSFSGKHCTRAVVAYANYETAVDMFSAKMPEEEGQYLIEISFTGKAFAMEEKLPNVEAGKYNVGDHWGGEPGVTVTVYDHNRMSMANVFSRVDDMTGGGELTDISFEHMSGSFDITDKDGNNVKGSFSLPVEKDMFDNVR